MFYTSIKFISLTAKDTKVSNKITTNIAKGLQKYVQAGNIGDN